MNSIIVLPEECRSETLAIIEGERARYVHAAHDLKLGISVKGSVWNGKRGIVTVKEVAPERIALELDINQPTLEKLPIDLIVAVPRPQTVRKVIHYAATLGVSRVHFLVSKSVPKSYLDSTALEPATIKEELIKALEQGYDSTPAEILIHRYFEPFINETLLELNKPQSIKLIAHTQAQKAVEPKSLRLPAQTPLIAAIGPESGWTEYEFERFLEREFVPVTLGPRILRVETAVAYLLGQLQR